MRSYKDLEHRFEPLVHVYKYVHNIMFINVVHYSEIIKGFVSQFSYSRMKKKIGLSGLQDVYDK